MTKILHAMLGKGLGGLEQVFLDYQPLLEAIAGRRGGSCVGVVRRGGKVALAQAGRSPGLTAIPAFTDWDPITTGAARRLVKALGPDLILSHGQRPARLFARVAGPATTLAVCVHKPSFDVTPGTHYLCVGRHLADLARERGADEGHVHIIPNAVKPPTALASPFSRPGQSVRVIAAGRLHAKKGFDVLIRAMAHLRAWGIDAVCEIAGEGDQRVHLQNLIDELDLAACVRLVGWTADVPGFLASGDVFAFPSHQEGFPLTLLEAMAVGLPVVASEIDGPIEILREGKTGRLVPDDDPDRLAEALGEVIADPQGAQAMAAAARTLVLADYGPAQLSQRLEAAVEAMLRP